MGPLFSIIAYIRIAYSMKPLKRLHAHDDKSIFTFIFPLVMMGAGRNKGYIPNGAA
jgi:tellurite resistance protein TehA-like permease